MPIGDIYPNLPGTLVRLHDGGLTVRAPQPYRTDAVMLMGCAEDGPVRTPVLVTSIQDMEDVFGRVTVDSAVLMRKRGITRAIYEAYYAGCTEIWVCRVNGTTAGITLSSSAGDMVTLTTAYGGAQYNANNVVINATTLTINTVNGSASYTLASYLNYQQLVDAINMGLITHRCNAFAITQIGTPIFTTGTFAFTGGTDEFELTDAQYSDRLKDTYEILEGKADFDVITPLGAYMIASGNSTGMDPANFGQNLAQFVARNTTRNAEMLGIISMEELRNPTPVAVNARATALKNTSFTPTFKVRYCTGSEDPTTVADELDTVSNLPIHTGMFINIIAGPETIFNARRLGTYAATNEAFYSGLVSSLPLDTAATGKVINGVKGLRYEFSQSQLNDITGSRFVTVANSKLSTIIVDAMTYALSSSDYRRLSTVRIVNAVIDVVRSIGQQFIGQVNDTISRNAMASAIQAGLQSLQKMRAIQYFQFQMIASATNIIDGKLIITLNIVPAFEIRQIEVNVHLMPPEGFSSTTSA